MAGRVLVRLVLSPHGLTGFEGAAIALVVAGMISQQFGAAVASLLFAQVGAVGVVSLRLVLAAVVLLVVCRPVVRGYRPAGWGVIIAFGAALVGMSTLIYQTVARPLLGARVALEVLTSLTLSVLAV